MQIDNDMFTKVMGYIDAGKKGGARCVAGGARQGNVGYFVQPTVFADVKDDMKIAREEVSQNIIWNTQEITIVYWETWMDRSSKTWK